MSLPIVDVSVLGTDREGRYRLLAPALDEALRVHGFVALSNLPVPRDLIERAFAQARDFFAGSSADKAPYTYRSAAANFGYQGLGVEALDPGTGADRKETFTMRNAPALAGEGALWPSETFRDTSTELFETCFAAAMDVLRVLTVALEVEMDFFSRHHHGENTTLRYLHYPASNQPDAPPGAGAHTDYGSLTLLFPGAEPGLQLLRDGRWWDVPSVPDIVVVNTGDLLAHWSNDRYPSTTHRVRQPARTRSSIAFFVDPDSDTPVDCLASCVDAKRPAGYRPTTAGAHIQRKIRATH